MCIKTSILLLQMLIITSQELNKTKDRILKPQMAIVWYPIKIWRDKT
jgi:hypothetical protein